MLFVPCLGCDGKGHWADRWKGDVETCDSCLGEGKHEVSQDEYDKFWEHFSRDDFK